MRLNVWHNASRVVGKEWLGAIIFLFTNFCTFAHSAADSQPEDARHPIPAFAKQLDATKLLEETQGIKGLDTASKKKAAVKKLMELARAGNLATEELYVVLTKAVPLAKEVEDVPAMIEALRLLTTSFAVDNITEPCQAWNSYFETCTTKTLFKPAADAAAEISREAMRQHRYTDGITLLKSAEAAAARLEVASSLKQSITKELSTLTARETEWKKFQAASDKLKAVPADPNANFTAGKWYALEEGNWSQALPLLARANDAGWKSAASLELENPSDATKQLAIADAWWDLAAKTTDSTKNTLLLHSGLWYEKAAANITSPLKKQALNSKLVEIAALRSSQSASNTARGKGASSDRIKSAVKSGEWVDLLAWTEGISWAQKGFEWNKHLESAPGKNGLTLKSLRFNRYPLPAIIDGDYELEAEFTRHSGYEAIVVAFPVGIHNVQFEVSSFGGKSSFIAFVKGKIYGEQNPCPVAPDERHRILIRVKVNGEKASIKVDWDEKQDYIVWEGPHSTLTNVSGSGGWKFTTVRHPWIGSYESRVTFHQVRVRMLSGEIQRDVINVADREVDLKNGLVRLVGEKANTPQAGWGGFFVNQLPFEMGPGDDERAWPLVAMKPSICDDFYGAHGPSRLKCPIPKSAKSFTVYGSNDGSRTTKFIAYVDGKELYHSGITDLARIQIDLPPDASLLELVCDPCGDNHNDHCYWCFPRYHTVTVDKLTEKMLEGKLSSTGLKFTVASGTVGAHKLTHNQPIKYLTAVPLSSEDQVPCHEFLYAHAPSTVTYAVPEGMSRFTAIGYNVRSQHTRFEVWADAKKIYESPQAGIIPMDVKLPKGTKTIELKVKDLGDDRYDQSMWCYPRLHRK